MLVVIAYIKNWNQWKYHALYISCWHQRIILVANLFPEKTVITANSLLSLKTNICTGFQKQAFWE